jgi:hypothetical protein
MAPKGSIVSTSPTDEALARLAQAMRAGRERIAHERAAGHPGPRPRYLAGWFDAPSEATAHADSADERRATTPGNGTSAARPEVRRQATLAIAGISAVPGMAVPATFESPLEERLAQYAERVIRADALYETQVVAATLAGNFRLDAVLSVGRHRIGLEVDGKEFHSGHEQEVRDRWRDALILGSQAVGAVYRLPGYAVDRWPYETIEAVCHAERYCSAMEWCSSRGALLLPSVRSPAARTPVMPHQGAIRVEFDEQYGLRRWDQRAERWVVADGITDEDLDDYYEARSRHRTRDAGPGAECIEWRGITVRRHAFSIDPRTLGASLRAAFLFALEQGPTALDRLRRAWANRAVGGMAPELSQYSWGRVSDSNGYAREAAEVHRPL